MTQMHLLSAQTIWMMFMRVLFMRWMIFIRFCVAPNRKRKILIVFDDMIADIMTNKKFKP